MDSKILFFPTTKKEWPLYGSAFLLMFLVFSPYFFSDFGFHNDYSVLNYDRHQFRFSEGFAELPMLFLLGRPLGAYLLSLHLYPLDHFQAFAYGRFVSFLVIFLLTLLLTHYLRSRGRFSALPALLLSVGIFLLPPIVLNGAWLTNFIPGIFSLLFVFGAAYAFEFSREHNGGRFRTFMMVLGLLTACLLFQVVLSIYPPMAMFLVVFPVIRILFSKTEGPGALRLPVYYAGFISVNMVVYFLVTKFLVIPHFISKFPALAKIIAENDVYRFGLSANLVSKFGHLGSILATAFKSYDIFYGYVSLVVLGLGAVLGLVFIENWKVKKIFVPWRFLFLGFFFVLGVAPLLLSQTTVIYYRSIFPIMALALLLPFFGFQRFLQPRKSALRRSVGLAGFAMVIIFSFLNVRAIAQNAVAEFKMTQNALEKDAGFATKKFFVGILPLNLNLGSPTLPLDLGLLAQHSYPQNFSALIRGASKNKISGIHGPEVEFFPAGNGHEFSGRGAGLIAIDFFDAPLFAAPPTLDWFHSLDFVRKPYKDVSGVERVPEGGLGFKWGRGPVSKFTYVSKKKKSNFYFDFENFLIPLQDVGVFVNGKRIGGLVLSAGERKTLKLSAFTSGLVELELRYGDWNHHGSNHYAPGDPRFLALSIHGLRID